MTILNVIIKENYNQKLCMKRKVLSSYEDSFHDK